MGKSVVDALKANLMADQTYEYTEEDKALGTIIDKIFTKSNDLNEIESEVILAMQQHLEEQLEAVSDTKQQEAVEEGMDSIEEEKEKISERVKGFVREKIKKKIKRKFDIDKSEDLDKDGKETDKYSQNITAQSKKNIKRLIKNFAIYEIYQVMNPRRIAGETAKDNYRHNLMARGAKVAAKYTGGTKADLEKYGSKEVERMKLQAAQYHKGNKEVGRQI